MSVDDTCVGRVQTRHRFKQARRSVKETCINMQKSVQRSTQTKQLIKVAGLCVCCVTHALHQMTKKWRTQAKMIQNDECSKNKITLKWTPNVAAHEHWHVWVLGYAWCHINKWSACSKKGMKLMMMMIFNSGWRAKFTATNRWVHTNEMNWHRERQYRVKRPAPRSSGW